MRQRLQWWCSKSEITELQTFCCRWFLLIVQCHVLKRLTVNWTSGISAVFSKYVSISRLDNYWQLLITNTALTINHISHRRRYCKSQSNENGMSWICVISYPSCFFSYLLWIRLIVQGTKILCAYSIRFLSCASLHMKVVCHQGENTPSLF